MLRFFRINDPYRLIYIFLILVIIRVVQGFFIPGVSYYELKWMLLGEWLADGYLMYDQTYDYTGPLAAMVYRALNHLFGRSQFVIQIVSSFFIIVQAGIFNSLLLRNKVYNENSYLPALLYTLLASCVPDFMSLSPQLMSMTFILLTFRNVIRRIDNQATDELFLSSGIFLGIAAMLYLPSVVFFFVFLFSLILFSSALPRRLILYLYGFVLVFIACGLYYYLFGSFGLFVKRAIMSGLLLPARISIGYQELLIFGAPFFLILFLSVVRKFGAARLTNFQQKVEQVIWILLIGGLVTFLLSNEQAGLEFIFLVPVVAYFWTHYFILLRRRFFRFIMPFVLILGSLSYTLYLYGSTTHSLLVPESDQQKEATLLIIGEKLELYAASQMKSPFFNGHMTQDLFAEMDTYRGSERFFELLESINPDVIVDDIGITPKMTSRLPITRRDYQKVDAVTFRKINN